MESKNYIDLCELISEFLKIVEKSRQYIQEFRKLIRDHLDPSEKDIDLDNTPIYLDEIDHHLHPRIQEILTNNFGANQEKNQVFIQICECLLKLTNEFPDISQVEMQKVLINNKLLVSDVYDNVDALELLNLSVVSH